jgi:hypothetical protein
MPEGENKYLLPAVGGTIAGAGLAAGVRSNRLSELATQRKNMAAAAEVKSKQAQRQLPKKQKPRGQGNPADPKGQWAKERLDDNPDEFRKQVNKRRLAEKAAQASKMAKGLTKKMGSLGATAGMADAAGSAARINKEGGSFEARFGKFAEELLGLPPGSTQRPLTEAEKKAQLSI